LIGIAVALVLVGSPLSLGLVLITPFRVPRDLIEVVVLPVVVLLRPGIHFYQRPKPSRFPSKCRYPLR
jgi:hypothetical protein